MDTIQDWLQSTGAALAESAARLAPSAVAVVVLVVATAVAAWLAQRLIERASAAAGIEQRLRTPGLPRTLGRIASAIVWLLGLPAILAALGLQALLGPVQSMLTKLLGFLPNLVGAGVILAIGVLIAGIVRQIVTGLLQAMGSEKLVAVMGRCRRWLPVPSVMEKCRWNLG